MKKLYYLLLLVLLCTSSPGQNLLPNGDFEIYVSCPLWYNDLDTAYAWSNPMTNVPGVSGTPDFFHECAAYPVGEPHNFQGYQYPHSWFAYAGIYLKEGDGVKANHREYIQTFFTSPLVEGRAYHFEMHVNLANNCRYTTSDIGVYISNTFMSGINNQDPLLYLPTIANESDNTFDTARWTVVSGNFIAAGGEQYLVIGNFKNDLQMNTVLYNPTTPADYIYVYIDDVSISPRTTTVGINENKGNAISLYPNPAGDYFYLSHAITPQDDAMLTVFNAMGQQVMRYSLPRGSENERINCKDLTPGIYTVAVEGGDCYRKRIVIQ